MSTRLLHPTNTTLNGVWLLDHDALEALDAELDAVCDRLNETRKATIQKAIRRARDHINKQQFYDDHPEERKKAIADRKKDIETSYKYSKNTCKAVLNCASKRRVELDRFARGFASAETRDLRPESIDVRIEIGEVDASLNLDGDRMSIHVHPDKAEDSSWVFARLEAWALRHKADRTLTLWNSASPLFGSIGFGFGLAMLVYTVAHMLSPPAINKSELRNTARELLADGLDESEHTEAIETLLSFTTEVPVSPDSSSPKWPVASISIFALCAALFAVGVCHPTTQIGVGKGSHALRRHKRWLRFVTYGLPAFIVCGVVASAFGSELHRFLSTASSR